MTTTRSTFHAAALIALLTFTAPQAVQAQSAKGTLQVQPRPSATSTVPAGADAGTPGTSNSVPLGTPTMPANDAERNDMRKASAAARAAARRRATPVAADSAASTPGAAAAEAARTSPKSAPGKVSLQGTVVPAPTVSPAPSPTPSRPAR